MTINLRELRKKIRMQRVALPEQARKESSIKIANTIHHLKIFKSCKHIAAYIAFNGEVDPAPLINYAWQEHKLCYVPLIKNDKMFFIKYEEGDNLIKNHCGILEPIFNANKLILPEKLELVIVPLVGFDLQGNRLGTGGGYYDRTFSFLKKSLQHHPYLLGIAYEFQKLENLTPQEWDIPLDMVVTEVETYSSFC